MQKTLLSKHGKIRVRHRCPQMSIGHEVQRQLCRQGYRPAARELYIKYRWGDKGNGIAVDLKQARTYYKLAVDTIEDYLLWDLGLTQEFLVQ